LLKDNRKKVKKTPQAQEKINWSSIQNEKFKNALQTILELKKNDSFIKNSEK
jgi:hypothetical protein